MEFSYFDDLDEKISKTIVHSNTLKKKSINKQEVAVIISDFIKQANTEIQEAHKTGATSCTITLPFSFDIQNIKTADVQRIIYFHILKIIESRKYSVELVLENKTYSVCISWKDIVDKNTEKIQVDYLKSKLVIKQNVKRDAEPKKSSPSSASASTTSSSPTSTPSPQLSTSSLHLLNNH